MADTQTPLDPVIDFVNTFDRDKGIDALKGPADLAAWLRDRGLLSSSSRAPTRTDFRHAIELREALRSLMLANNGAPENVTASAELERAARRGDLRVRFAQDGSIGLEPGAQGVSGALAALLAPVALAIGDGTWRRAKACREHSCQWAFYDRSRNRSGVWCEMTACGNRSKVRAYRERTSG